MVEAKKVRHASSDVSEQTGIEGSSENLGVEVPSPLILDKKSDSAPPIHIKTTKLSLGRKKDTEAGTDNSSVNVLHESYEERKI